MSFAMKARHVPVNGLSYWLALCLASILGCNTGDYWASFFGFVGGLPVLLAAFAAILYLERRDDRTGEGYYWVAIILVRTAATNLADVAAKQMGIAVAMALLAALMLALTLSRYRAIENPPPVVDRGLPQVDLVYWATMLVAGTLGTVLGDFASFRSGMGLGGASLVLSAVVALMIAGQISGALRAPATYWLVVVTIRAAGTSVGDFSARHIGLWQSTAIFAILLIGYTLVNRPVLRTDSV